MRPCSIPVIHFTCSFITSDQEILCPPLVSPQRGVWYEFLLRFFLYVCPLACTPVRSFLMISFTVGGREREREGVVGEREESLFWSKLSVDQWLSNWYCVFSRLLRHAVYFWLPAANFKYSLLLHYFQWDKNTVHTETQNEAEMALQHHGQWHSGLS